MSKRQPFRMLISFVLAAMLATLSIASQRQRTPSAKSTALDASCMYDFERGVIPDCLHKAANGELSVKPQVLKQLQVDSHGLAVVRSATNGWMYVSRTGKVVVRNGKYGFSNRAGALLISPTYNGAMNFENGKAKVCNGCTNKCVEQECEYQAFSGGEWFEIDTKGTVVSRIPAEN